MTKVGYNWFIDKKQNRVPDYVQWSWGWKLFMPENIHFFICQVAHDVVPTFSLLAHRKITLSDCCKIHPTALETLLHCIGDCSIAKQVGRTIDFVLPQQFFSQAPFRD